MPYKGCPATTDTISGQVPILFTNRSSTAAFIPSGKIRPLAVALNKHSSLAPNVSTSASSAWAMPATKSRAGRTACRVAMRQMRHEFGDTPVVQDWAFEVGESDEAPKATGWSRYRIPDCSRPPSNMRIAPETRIEHAG